MMTFKKYDESDKGTFHYWFEHVKAYNWVAWNWKVWKPKYLFHDFEKPWLKLILGDYMKVRKYHKAHSRHHLGYQGHMKRDWEAMILDWECSRYTKLKNPYDCIETIDWMYRRGRVNIPEVRKLVKTYKNIKRHGNDITSFCIGISGREFEMIDSMPYFKILDENEVVSSFLVATMFGNKVIDLVISDTPKGSIILSEDVFHEFFRE